MLYKNLIINDGVVTNPNIDKVLGNLDYFVSNSQYTDVTLYITSAVRTTESQLKIINNYAYLKSVIYKPEMVEDVNKKIFIPVLGKEVYSWQRTWSKLLNIGIIVNPPFEAEVLEDYWKTINGLKVNRKGTMIKGSPHILGKAFDVSGRNGIDLTFACLDTAMKSGVGITNILIERENNALHNDIT